MSTLRKLFLGAVLVVSSTSCSTDGGVAPQPTTPTPTAAQTQAELSGLLGGDLSNILAATVGSIDGLLTCTPIPPATTTATVGPLGGVINVGPHVLTIPPGALSRQVTITASITADSNASIGFQPEGLQFSKAARPWLTLSYQNCPLIGPQLLPIKRIAYTTDKFSLLAVLTSFDNPLTRKVYAPLEHFSRYAVAW